MAVFSISRHVGCLCVYRHSRCFVIPRTGLFSYSVLLDCSNRRFLPSSWACCSALRPWPCWRSHWCLQIWTASTNSVLPEDSRPGYPTTKVLLRPITSKRPRRRCLANRLTHMALESPKNEHERPPVKILKKKSKSRLRTIASCRGRCWRWEIARFVEQNRWKGALAANRSRPRKMAPVSSRIPARRWGETR